MKLTREQWLELEKKPTKERIERLEEATFSLAEELSDIRRKKFEEEMDKINEDADKHSIRCVIGAVCLFGIAVGIFLAKIIL